MKRRIYILVAIAALLVLVYCCVWASASLSQEEQQASTEAAANADSSTRLDSSIFSDQEKQFSTNLPIVVVDTQGQEINEEAAVRTSFAVIDGQETNTLYDGTSVNCFADLKIRGHSSADFNKKSYRLELYETETSTKEYNASVMGMSKESDWVLYGPYLDMTLTRNMLMYGIGRQTMEWAPDAKYCELWIDGEYQGVYVMVEKIKMSENRLNLTDYSLLTGESSFILSREMPDSEDVEFSTYANSLGLLYQSMAVNYPRATQITDSQLTWIEDYINEFERSLYSDYYLDDTRGYKSYIDLDSFATYYVLSEFSMNEDTGYHSTYCYRDVNGKLKAGPLWDFNSSFNNYVSTQMSPEGFYLDNNGWFERMLTDPEFVDAVVAKYRELRTGVLSDERLLSTLDSLHAQLGDAVERNDAVWSHYGQESGLRGSSRKYADYDAAMLQLKDCITKRTAWLDENIDDLYLNCDYE